MGPEIAAVIRSRGVAAKQGFLMYYSKGDAIGTKVSVRYRRSGRLSEVVVKRGSTVAIVNPRRACAVRVTVLGLCVCVCQQLFSHNRVQGEL